MIPICVFAFTPPSRDEDQMLSMHCHAEYWGEMGYIRVKFGKLLLEDQCAWAVPATWTEWNAEGKYGGGGSPNFPCYEDGSVRTYFDIHPSPHPSNSTVFMRSLGHSLAELLRMALSVVFDIAQRSQGLRFHEAASTSGKGGN